MSEDLDKWLHYYNTERSHSGRYCFGKTPMQTWLDSKELANKNRLTNCILQLKRQPEVFFDEKCIVFINDLTNQID
ncbi:hypothetical protein SAMN05216311_11615 [Chitinophaga sp. CF418]|nr:hypothetical protein SAMN05216311_11615 [Chitinophaga sp. CF418]